MAFRILQVEGRVLSCQSKPNENKRLQKICKGFINCLCMQIFRVNVFLKFFYFGSDDFIMAIARFLFCTLAFSLLVNSISWRCGALSFYFTTV